MRARTKVRKSGATAEAAAETANRTAATLSTRRRPMRSLNGPDSSMPIVAVSDNEDTDQPS